MTLTLISVELQSPLTQSVAGEHIRLEHGLPSALDSAKLIAPNVEDTLREAKGHRVCWTEKSNLAVG